MKYSPPECEILVFENGSIITESNRTPIIPFSADDDGDDAQSGWV